MDDPANYREEKMKRIWIGLFIGLLLLTACSNGAKPTNNVEKPTPTPTQGLPTPVVQTTSMPDVTETVLDFLEKWENEDYSGMYAMLANTSRDAITEEDFTKVYKDTAINLTLKDMEYGIATTLVTTTSAKVGYKVNFITSLFSEIVRQMEMNLVIDNGAWRIQWEHGMVMPELTGGKKLALQVKSPTRGDIYDRNGEPIATQSEAAALGIVPGQMTDEGSQAVLDQLNLMTGIPKNMIIDKYRGSTSEFYVPIAEVSAQTYYRRAERLNSLTGLVINLYTDRYYYFGGIAPQAVGYLLSISPEEYDAYRRSGYAGDERIGSSGIEKWGEAYLRGEPSAELYVVNPDGTYDTRLGSKDSKAPNNIYTTLDSDLQLGAQKALIGFTGAIVVLERDTGRVLAMASSPGFDPNSFQVTNYNSQYTLGDLVNDPNTPLYNRAAQSAYPLGSVFKLITTAAGLESGLYTPETTYECTSQFTELPGYIGNDWTYDKDLPPSGTLTLVEGIMRSCNPWFYHIGLDLYRYKGPDYLANMARSFGLGEATGIDAVSENPGSIVNPTFEGGGVQMGIGQGDMLVTPLQVANFVAAIGNGGTLYRPQIIEKVTTLDGDVIEEFSPEVIRQLPVSQENLAAIKEGMRLVVENKRGTAYQAFWDVTVPVYAKTGTATTSVEDPHSWFAGFTEAVSSGKPDISVAVIAEYAGDGSRYAAYLFRRVIEYYYGGEVQRLYPWEKDYFLTVTPAAPATPEP